MTLEQRNVFKCDHKGCDSVSVECMYECVMCGGHMCDMHTNNIHFAINKCVIKIPLCSKCNMYIDLKELTSKVESFIIKAIRDIK